MEVKRVNLLPLMINEAYERLSPVADKGKTLIWFGYAMHLNAIQKALMAKGVKISFAVDNERNKWGLDPFGILECRSPDELAAHIVDGVVIIASEYKDEIAAQVISYGFAREQIICLKSPDEYCADVKSQYFPELALLRLLTLDELQDVLSGALTAFRDFCTLRNLRYFLAEGTLLGAVRHSGFIPWDNDVDVFMPYEDMQKFIGLYKDNDRHILLHWSRNSGYRRSWARLVDTGTYLFESRRMCYQLSAAGIDIFPIGGFPADESQREKRIKEIYEQNILWDCLDFEPEQTSGDTQKRLDAYADIEKNKYRDAFDGAEYVGAYHFETNRVKPWTVPYKCFSECIQLQFENELFCAPKGYDKYLTTRYGDYMTLPPEPERFSHPWDAYWR